MDDIKERIRRAVLKNQQSLLPKKKREKKNAKPEIAVQDACLLWMRSRGFDMDVVESKAVFNPKVGRYLSSQATPGISDSVGNDKDGRAIYVEFKAPGKRYTLRPNQRMFLMKKIMTHCFAVVVDSHEMLETFYHTWLSKLNESQASGRQYLLDQLPEKKNLESTDNQLFEEQE